MAAFCDVAPAPEMPKPLCPIVPPSGAARENPEEWPKSSLAQIAANGMNAVRTYTVPPRWLLDTAQRHGLHVMVGLPWEQHIAFLDDNRRAHAIEQRVRAGVRECVGHPAVLCYVIGNEIPAPIAWFDARCPGLRALVLALWCSCSRCGPQFRRWMRW